MNKMTISLGIMLTVGTFMFMSVPSVIAQEPDIQFIRRFDIDFDGKVTKGEYKSAGGNMERWAERDLDSNNILEGKELIGVGGKGGKKGKKGK